ncbi:MAG: hypothetical protein GY842_21820 [bacterium]|nr:hypothetical protein [bacterium]
MLGPALTLVLLLAGGALDEGVQRVDLERGYYLLVRPEAVPADTPLPLVVCLHGTETSAVDILRFWRSLRAELPVVFVAPQGSRAGWRASDMPLLREMVDDVRGRVVFDPGRVLLTGHSAGGATAFRLAYVEGFPATALAVTANYLPPAVTDEQISARMDVPVFYAVGTHDLNRDRMRTGVSRLREAGVRVTMRRPRIGHVLDAKVGQEALVWFEQVCRDRVQACIDASMEYGGPSGTAGGLAAELEGVFAHPEGQFSEQLQPAQRALARLEAPGRRRLAEARRLADGRRYREAHALLRRVERDYSPAALSAVARKCRERLERDPTAAAELEDLVKPPVSRGGPGNPSPTAQNGE